MFPVKEVSDAELAFPATVLHLMPKYEDIPEEFKATDTKWNRFFRHAFYFGVSKLEFRTKPGVDPEKAYRHVRTIMGSFEPKHEHKEAAVAFLLSQWFDDVAYEYKKPELETLAE